ncbi:unnamed protein product [Prorocentrum cordatum]|uniref:ABC transporter domain-containing protein n=1 Tax=Prorocentrum cordatum TaxID=2364126 RepID=A0ABN9Y362_9DINO|nr:unnamed protein product [Polarella glacialis]
MQPEAACGHSSGDPLHAGAAAPPREPPPGLVAGLVTECLPEVGRETLARGRDELDQIQRQTGAQLTARENLRGGYTVVVAGTRSVVESAIPQVRRALAGAGPRGAPQPGGADGCREPPPRPPRAEPAASAGAQPPEAAARAASTARSPAPGPEPGGEAAEPAAAGRRRKKKTKAKAKRRTQHEQPLEEPSFAGPDSPDGAKVAGFVFPVPGAMKGVKSWKKVIFKMSNVSFAYPACKSPSILDVNIEMSQTSRILVTGARGSGKSTLVKVMIGKLKLTEGAIQKAVGVSVAYVSQHMFHPFEVHAHMTPLQYMMWRFADGSDRENPEFQQYRELRLPTQEGVEQHCSDFGLDRESVSRLHMKQLDKSTRFKLVLSAAMWLNPNLLILDEPASCLDRCCLEALVAALEGYRGGVLVTAQSRDGHCFEGAAAERYVLRGGRLRPDVRGGAAAAVGAAALEGSDGVPIGTVTLELTGHAGSQTQ